MNFSLNNVFLFILYLIIPVDLFTGSVLIDNTEANPIAGKLFKFLILLLISFNLFKINKTAILSVIILFIITFISSINGSLFELPLNFINGSKIILFILIYYQCFYLSKIRFFDNNYIFKLIFLSTIFLMLNQIFGLLGYGKPTYYFDDLKLGTSGFFYETNSYGFVLIIIEAILLMSISKKYNIRIFLFTSIIFIFLGLSIATKLAMFGAIIVPTIILFFVKRKYFYISFIFIFLILITQFNQISNLNQLQKILVSLEQNSIQSSLFSGRDERLTKSFDDYFSKFSLSEMTFGIGYARVLNDSKLADTSEMDFIDILKMSGFLGFFLVYIPFVLICISHFKNYKKYHIVEFKIVLILNIFILIASTIGGHLFTSGTPTVFLAILNIYPQSQIKLFDKNYFA